MIPFFSLEGRRFETGTQVQLAIEHVLSSDHFVGGDAVLAFEEEYAAYTGLSHVAGTGNGLDALRIGLQALGVCPGDEVIVPAFTFVATWLAILQLGAHPIGVDVDLSSGNIDPTAVEAAVTPRTVGIVAVHLYGRPAPLQRLSEIAQRWSLFLAEDAAQGHGLEVTRSPIGSLSAFVAYSFYPTKNLGAVGDAGAVGTKSESLIQQVRRLRSYGADQENKYRHETNGWNSRLDPIQAAALSVFLPYLNTWNERRRELARQYLAALRMKDSVYPLDATVDPGESVWHHFIVRSNDRDELRERLRVAGIGTDVHYPTVAALAPAVAKSCRYHPEQFPRSCELAGTVVSLPMHPWLEKVSQELMDRIDRACD